MAETNHDSDSEDEDGGEMEEDQEDQVDDVSAQENEFLERMITQAEEAGHTAFAEQYRQQLAERKKAPTKEPKSELQMAKDHQIIVTDHAAQLKRYQQSKSSLDASLEEAKAAKQRHVEAETRHLKEVQERADQEMAFYKQQAAKLI